ncbi:porin, partial [Streptomyces sp. AC04842]|nr:porin [Streptomyces sp. AC04842]
YGIADVSIRYVNTSDGQTGQDGSRIAMANGAISNSRWGLRGSEDLGDGNRAFFRLEQGFNVQNGKASDTSKTFNRLAYVGLDGGKIGALTLGLQNTVIQDLMADYFDPLTVGNYNENSWLPAAMGRVRTNNAFRYSNTLGDLAVAAQWANGDKWSDRAAGQQMGISLRYTVGQLGLGGAFQKTFGANDSDLRQQVWNLSASYQFESAKIFAGYFNGRD